MSRFVLPEWALPLLLLLVIVAAHSCATSPSPIASSSSAAVAAPAEVAIPVPALPAVKPVAANKVAATVRGCLARADLGQEPETRLPPKRGADEPLPELIAEAYDWGLVVRHKLRHPCCLTGSIDAEIEGHLVVVTERLTGTPCNCYCWSTVLTRVGLPVGDYDLLVEQIGPAGEGTLLFTTFEVGNPAE